MIEYIKNNEQILALIIRNNYHAEGIKFITPDNFSQQIGYMNRPQNYEIKPHIHNPVARKVEYTKEVILVKKGMVRVDFYDEYKNYLGSKILHTGDITLLAFGGHGFKMLEDSEIIEVKQGPYVGDVDKTRFSSTPDEEIILLGNN